MDVDDIRLGVGEFVRRRLGAIFHYCNTHNHEELVHLSDAKYSKNTFDLNHPFCSPIDQITQAENRRYYSRIHIVQGVSVRVTNDWYERNRNPFGNYLRRLGIADTGEQLALMNHVSPERNKSLSTHGRKPERRAAKGRYKGHAIGNSQNLLIRNILSNLGDEAFGEADWQRVIDTFAGRCAYCGVVGKLVMDHIIPINRTALGEHRVGNLVPACDDCNKSKGDKDYRDFLVGKPEAVAALEAHMERHNYVPLGNNDQIRMILDLAHKEVPLIAERYVRILDSLLSADSHGDRLFQSMPPL